LENIDEGYELGEYIDEGHRLFDILYREQLLASATLENIDIREGDDRERIDQLEIIERCLQIRKLLREEK
jgi:hypothetical protein